MSLKKSVCSSDRSLFCLHGLGLVLKNMGIRLLLFLSLSLAVNAEGFLPDAPVKKFELPWFDPETNFLKMKLQGEEGLIAANGSVSIRKMTILLFSPEKGATPETLITSPSANLFPSQATARGAEELDIQAEQFSLSGKNWEWQWKQNRLQITDGVVLRLKQELSPILQ